MRNCLKQNIVISLEDIEEAEFTNDKEHETLHVKQHLHIQTMTYLRNRLIKINYTNGFRIYQIVFIV